MEDKEFYEALGQALRQERKRRKWTLAEVAEKLGVSLSTVSCWEIGERTISASQWKRYCHLLGMSLDEFVEKYSL